MIFTYCISDNYLYLFLKASVFNIYIYLDFFIILLISHIENYKFNFV